MPTRLPRRAPSRKSAFEALDELPREFSADRHARPSAGGATAGAADYVRVRPLLGIPRLLEESGVPPATVFQRAGIDPRMLDDPDNRISFDELGRLLDECVAATGCAHFGLLAGQRVGADALGLILELVLSAPTVGAGLRALIAYLHLYDRGAVPVLSPLSAREAEFAYVIQHRGTPATAQISDASMVIASELMRSICGPDWTPTRVTFAHSRPRDVRPYRSHFRCPLEFDAARSAVVFPLALLDQPIPGSDARAEARLRAILDSLAESNTPSMAHRIRQVLVATLVSGAPTFDQVARATGLSRRTLRRRLADEGTSVSALLDDVRCELARQLLEETRMPLGDIAAALHYSRPGAFSRAYKGWTGMSPRQSRAGRSHRKASSAQGRASRQS